jgi:hypothetical protein
MLKQLFIATSLVSAAFGAEDVIVSNKHDAPAPLYKVEWGVLKKNSDEISTTISQIHSRLAEPNLSETDQANLLVELMEVSLDEFNIRFGIDRFNFDDFDSALTYSFKDATTEQKILSHSKSIILSLFDSLSDPEHLNNTLYQLTFFAIPSVITADILDAFLSPSQLSKFDQYMVSNTKEGLSIMTLILLLTHSAKEPHHFKALQEFTLKHLSKFLMLKGTSTSMYLYLAYATCDTTPLFIHDLLIGLVEIMVNHMTSENLLEHIKSVTQESDRTSSIPDEGQLLIYSMDLFTLLKNYHSNIIMAIKEILNFVEISTNHERRLDPLLLNKSPNDLKYQLGNAAYFKDPTLPLSKSEEDELDVFINKLETTFHQNNQHTCSKNKAHPHDHKG